MNVNPRRKHKLLQDTIIPLNNPLPRPGNADIQGMLHSMIFSQDHPDKKLLGISKGMKAVLCNSVQDELERRCTKVVGKCKTCTTPQIRNDAE
jgi:hypothetical protein